MNSIKSNIHCIQFSSEYLEQHFKNIEANLSELLSFDGQMNR